MVSLPVMRTFHIHIQGVVQGVGFRPFVFQMARKYAFKGWVSNTLDGVHIEVNGEVEKVRKFLHELINNPPVLAQITGYDLKEVDEKQFENFEIVHSEEGKKPRLLLTPDVKICHDCLRELFDQDDRRYGYPFITCTNCGPRYSIIEKLPYDRPHTTMKEFKMCELCEVEYHDPENRRHFSQTNSCHDCKVAMQLYEKGRFIEDFQDLNYIVEQWKKGGIVAIKGIGGYLLTCDASDPHAVKLLRERKNRPYKPFALMYPSKESIEKDCKLSEDEWRELESVHSPIVLLQLKKEIGNRLALKELNDGLARLGVMIPYTPLLAVLLKIFNAPIVATSGNVTDSAIIYEDDTALSLLSQIADLVLLNNRAIVVPQDDGVVQFSAFSRQKITLRRSRGKAPIYINARLKLPQNIVFSTGSMLKSVFGLLNEGNVYISQYLGNTENYESQEVYEKVFNHLEKIFQPEIDTVITDLHPDYYSTRFGEELVVKYKAALLKVQHHKAHFYAVLGENDLLGSSEKILGVVWDGTGLGEDGNIWGGEFFIYQNRVMKRAAHLPFFPFMLGDKMVREPRLSLLALTWNDPAFEQVVKTKFTETEWRIYHKLLENKPTLMTSSMGRLVDAAASLLFGFDIHRYDAQAAMKFEQEASMYYYKNFPSLSLSYLQRGVPENLTLFLLRKMLYDMKKGEDKAKIAAKFHLSLVSYIKLTAHVLGVKRIAFSGGVFQNALLTDMLHRYLKKDYELFFPLEFSPNDEGIPFGQLMYYVDQTGP